MRTPCPIRASVAGKDVFPLCIAFEQILGSVFPVELCTSWRSRRPHRSTRNAFQVLCLFWMVRLTHYPDSRSGAKSGPLNSHPGPTGTLHQTAFDAVISPVPNPPFCAPFRLRNIIRSGSALRPGGGPASTVERRPEDCLIRMPAMVLPGPGFTTPGVPDERPIPAGLTPPSSTLK